MSTPTEQDIHAEDFDPDHCPTCRKVTMFRTANERYDGRTHTVMMWCPECETLWEETYTLSRSVVI